MAAGQYTFTIEQGTTVDFRIEYTDAINVPIDLTDYHARMQIRPTFGGVIHAELSSSLHFDGTGLNMTPLSGSLVLPKSSGSIQIYISAATTSMFTFDTARYDIEIVSGSATNDYVKRILEGKIKLKKEITI
tara:strand:+ start:7655 stop:8050 length:396 start_codon:yes stop_codon:yes gene_type:complete